MPKVSTCSSKVKLHRIDKDTDSDEECYTSEYANIESKEGAEENSSFFFPLFPRGGHAHHKEETDSTQKSGKHKLRRQAATVSWANNQKDGRVSTMSAGSLNDSSTKFEKVKLKVKRDCCVLGRDGNDCEHTSLTPNTNLKKSDDVTVEDEGIIPPWRSCLIMSISFLFVYTSFEAIQNLQSSLNNDGNLGVVSLSVNYLCVIIGSALGPINARIFGPKRLLQLAFVLHLCYICSNFYPSFAVFVPMSALLGIGIGGLAMSMGLYLAAASNSYIALKGLKPEDLHGILSMFNGIFYSCFKGTHISGNLISSLVLFSSSYNGTILENNVCGADVCATSHNSTVIEKPDDKVVYLLLLVFILSNLIGFTILTIGLPTLRVAPDQDDQSKKTNEVVRNLSGCVRRAFSFRFLLLMPMFMAQAMVVMIIYTGYTEAFVTCTIGIQWVGYAMVSLGVAAAISSLLVNNIARYVGRPTIFLFGIFIDIGTVVVMILWVPDRHTIKHILFVLPAVAGFSEGILQPQFNALTASVFTDNLPSAFSAFHGCKCLAFSISLAISSFACLNHRLYLALVLYLLGLVGYVVTEIREHQAKALLQDGRQDGWNNDFDEKENKRLSHRGGNVVSGTDNGEDGEGSDSCECTTKGDVRQTLLGLKKKRFQSIKTHD